MNCPHIPDVKYGDFSRRLHAEVDGYRIPIEGSIEITERCNLRCVHCYINKPFSEDKTRDYELSYEKIRDIIDQITDAGCLWLLITGGEPLVRTDFLDIYAYAKEKGLLITLFTNGTLINPEVASYLADHPPFAIEISLYGYSQEIYEKITRIPGSFEKCIQGIELLKGHELSLKLKTMAMTINHHELLDMKAFAKRHKVDFRFDPMLNVRLNKDKGPTSFRLDPETVVSLDMADEKRKKSWQKFSNSHCGPPERQDYLYRCGAGKNSFHIDSQGQLSACLMARITNFNLHNEKFIDGWKQLSPLIRKKKWVKETPCKSCELHAICGWCPGVAEMEAINSEAVIPYYCQVAHLRADSLNHDY